MNQKREFFMRINDWLRENRGEIFKNGKWRFWLPLASLLTLGSAILTALMFARSGGSVTVWLIVVALAILLCWIGIGMLHYSDSEDGRLMKNVSLLDSATLIFVIAEFCFLLWAFGHFTTLQDSDGAYTVELEKYNAKARDVSKDNVEVARSAERIAERNERAARLQNDTAYQQRKAVERGAKITATSGPVAGIGAGLSTAEVKLEAPKAPQQSAAQFLTEWDTLIRVANFGGLLMTAITLIYIRNRSARFNAQNRPESVLPVATVSHRGAVLKPALRANSAQKATPVATDPRKRSLDALRETLRDIAEENPGRFFKADLIDGGVAIRICRKERGRDVTIKTTHQSNKILDAVDRPGFRDRLINELKYQGFSIGGER